MSKILLIHGALGAADVLQPLAHDLKQQALDPVIIELPGHGKTPLNDVPFTIEGFANWLDDYIEREQLWGNPVFGFSMGGYIVLHLMAERKRTLGKIITLGTKFAWSTESASEEGKRLNPDKVVEKVPKFAALLDKRHSDWRVNMTNTRNLMLVLGTNPLLNEDKYARIENDVLILRGDNDNMVTEDESRNVAEHLPNGSYKVLKDTSHPIEQVSPLVIAQEIANFINS